MQSKIENPGSKFDRGQRDGSTKLLVAMVVLGVIFPLLVLGIVMSDEIAEAFTGTITLETESEHSSLSTRRFVGMNIIPLTTSGSSVASGPSIVQSNTPKSQVTINPTKQPVKSNIPKPKKKKTKVYNLKRIRYVTAVNGINVRKKASSKSKKIGKLKFGKRVKVAYVNKKWAVCKLKKTKKGKIVYGFLSRKYLSKHKPKYVMKGARGERIKSYMSYRTITSRSSPQYRLQRRAHTAKNGIRMANGRYCIAMGSYYTTRIGRYIDLILSNGTVIPCVLGDQKANKDTNSSHMLGDDGSIAEFIVHTGSLGRRSRRMGDVSYSNSSWRKKIVKVRLYNKNVFSK